MNRPAWFVATLLFMLAALMSFHLYLMYVGLRECDEYAAILLEQARRVAEQQTEQVKIEATNTECNDIEEAFKEASAQYVGLILALLGGAGMAGAAGAQKP